MKSFFNHAITSLEGRKASISTAVSIDKQHNDNDDMDIDLPTTSPCEIRSLRKRTALIPAESGNKGKNEDGDAVTKKKKESKFVNEEDEKIFEFIDFGSSPSSSSLSSLSSLSWLPEDEGGDGNKAGDGGKDDEAVDEEDEDAEFELDDTFDHTENQSLRTPLVGRHTLNAYSGFSQVSNHNTSTEDPFDIANHPDWLAEALDTVPATPTKQIVKDISTLPKDWKVSFITLKYREIQKESLPLQTQINRAPELHQADQTQQHQHVKFSDLDISAQPPTTQPTKASPSGKNDQPVPKTLITSTGRHPRPLFPLTPPALVATIDFNLVPYFKESIPTLVALSNLGQDIAGYDARSVGMATHISGQIGTLSASAPFGMVHDPDFGEFVGSAQFIIGKECQDSEMQGSDWIDRDMGVLAEDGVRRVLTKLARRQLDREAA